MNYTACNLIYVNKAAEHDELVRQEMDISNITKTQSQAVSLSNPSSHTNLLEHDIKKLMRVFNEVYICTSGKSCISKILELSRGSVIDLVPTIVLIDVPNEDQPNDKLWNEVQLSFSSSSPLVPKKEQDDSEQLNCEFEDKYGLELLQCIASEIEYQTLPSLIVPVAMIETPELDLQEKAVTPTTTLPPSQDHLSPGDGSDQRKSSQSFNYQLHTMRSLETGAVDVLVSPIAEERLSSLLIHAYRAHHNALKQHRALVELRRNRKRSWVGLDVNDEKPYAHLREAMVSGLMDGICQLGDHEPPPTHLGISIAPNRQEAISAALASWNFSAHDFTDDELLHSAILMLQHTLTMPELEPWRISTGKIPPYPDPNVQVPLYPSPLAESIRPYDALTLLITAIGHDVGHPGVNNAFLTALNAPLAQLYNNRSVLESFHCAAYSQILRCHWPSAFRSAEMRQLMISTILATDMGLHFEYMKKLAQVTENHGHPEDSTEHSKSWSSGNQRSLACSLLIKCADISNVARKFEIASKWTMILTDEFARQANMEKDIGIPSVLYAKPVREIVTLGESQISFMDTFALPLFHEVTKAMPAMSFCVEELQRNKEIWNNKILERRRDSEQESSAEMSGTPLSPQITVEKPSDVNISSLDDLSKRKSKKRPNLKPIDVDLSTAKFQNLSPFSDNPITKSFTNSDTRESSLTNSPLSGTNSFNQNFNFSECGSPTLTENKEHDLTPEFIGALGGSPLFTEESLTRKISYKSLQLEEGCCKNGTEGSGSVVDDWTSQATSENLPPSPSTQGSSITSYYEHNHETNSPHKAHEPEVALRHEVCRDTQSYNHKIPSAKDSEQCLKSIVVIQKVRSFRKNSSRFRMNFWRRSKRNNSLSIVVHDSDGERCVDTG